MPLVRSPGLPQQLRRITFAGVKDCCQAPRPLVRGPICIPYVLGHALGAAAAQDSALPSGAYIAGQLSGALERALITLSAG